MPDTTSRADAWALYRALDEILRALDDLDVSGEIGDVEDYDQAKYEAQITLEALAPEYDHA